MEHIALYPVLCVQAMFEKKLVVVEDMTTI